LTVCLPLSFTRDLKHSMFIWVNYLLPYFGLILVWKKYTKWKTNSQRSLIKYHKHCLYIWVNYWFIILLFLNLCIKSKQTHFRFLRVHKVTDSRRVFIAAASAWAHRISYFFSTQLNSTEVNLTGWKSASRRRDPEIKTETRPKNRRSGTWRRGLGLGLGRDGLLWYVWLYLWHDLATN